MPRAGCPGREEEEEEGEEEKEEEELESEGDREKGEVPLAESKRMPCGRSCSQRNEKRKEREIKQ